MSISLVRPLLLASLLALAGVAQATPVTASVDLAGNFSVTDITPPPNTPTTYHFNVAPTTYPIPAIYYDTNVPDQSPANIATDVAAAYGVSASTLALVGHCDDLDASCAGATATSNQFTLTNVSPFDYLAIHFGGGELFFHWAAPITSAVVTALDNRFPGGLSNYRSYLTTPLPGALALFLGALGFLGLRRKLVQPAGAEPTPA
jgi:hypothetical protein